MARLAEGSRVTETPLRHCQSDIAYWHSDRTTNRYIQSITPLHVTHTHEKVGGIQLQVAFGSGGTVAFSAQAGLALRIAIFYHRDTEGEQLDERLLEAALPLDNATDSPAARCTTACGEREAPATADREGHCVSFKRPRAGKPGS
jgi:hypothetical protein